jgi:hypothetical protein
MKKRSINLYFLDFIAVYLIRKNGIRYVSRYLIPRQVVRKYYLSGRSRFFSQKGGMKWDASGTN